MVEKFKPELIVFKVSDVEIKNCLKISDNPELKFQLINKFTGKFVHQSAEEALNKIWRIYPETEKYDQVIFILKTLSPDLIELGSASLELNQNFPIKQLISIQEDSEEIVSFNIEIVLKEIDKEPCDNLEMFNISDLPFEECKTYQNMVIETYDCCDKNSMEENIDDAEKLDINETKSVSLVIENTKLSPIEEEKSGALQSASLNDQTQLDQFIECNNSSQNIINADLDILQNKIQEGFIKHEIINRDQLIKKIEDCEKFIKILNKRGIREKAQKQEEISIELKNLLADFEEIVARDETFNIENLILNKKENEAIMEEKFKLGLEKKGIKSAEELFEKIKEKRAEVETLKQCKEYDLVNEEEKILEELEYLNSLYCPICINKNSQRKRE